MSESRYCTQSVREDGLLVACKGTPSHYVMAPGAGDWAYYVCAEHLPTAVAAGFTIVEEVHS